MSLTAYADSGKIVGSRRHVFEDPRLRKNEENDIVLGKRLAGFPNPFCWFGCDIDRSYTAMDLKKVVVTLVYTRVVF